MEFIQRLFRASSNAHLYKRALSISALITAQAFSVASADDTEIFFSAAEGDPSTFPNIVFVLDNSGSMRGRVPGTNQTKMEAMQAAMNSIIDTVDNINLGLVNFKVGDPQRGSTMVYPVTNIDAPGARQAMKDVVNAMRPRTATPLVGALYESAMIMRGGNIEETAATYTSPMVGECQKNHIVMLSDGQAWGNNAVSKTRNLIGGNCTWSGAWGSETCGVELAGWLAANDHAPSVPGDQDISVSTIGFNIRSTFLDRVATAGGGEYYEASRSEELVDVFNEIITSVKDIETTFVAPATSINQFNRLTQSNNLYFSMFKPESSAMWPGNLKRYQLGFQSGNVGNNVELGGVASKMQLGRNILTHIGGIPTGGQTLSTQLNSGAVSAAMLGVDNDTRTDILDWIDGRDVKDEDDDENRTEARRHLGDIIHSTPVSVNYASGQSTVFVGTNEGFLHGFDMGSGNELFAYIPEELLPNLGKFYNSVGAYLRPFGLDGEISLKHDDTNSNGVVDGSEQAIIYVGMRRGGRNYYAIDVTYRNSPRLLWKIEGGSGQFSRLGQTWSKPLPTKIWFEGAEKDVVIFGGGYDINQDPVDRRNDSPRSATDSVGNSLYIVDALSGAHIWSADQNLGVSGMDFSIPSDLRVIDVNGDSYADRIYVGDMGGQVWRFDIKGYHQSGGASSLVKGGIMAKLGSRRFYNEPDVALMSDKGQRFMSISIGSGWRASPTHTGTANRFYMVRDNNPLIVPDGYGKENGNVWDPITEGDLANVTNSVISATGTDPDPDGWMIDLTDSGEKNLSRSTTINNQVLFTTYTPIAAPDPCSPPSGKTHIYALNVLTGDPALALSSGGSGPGSTPSDRRRGMSTENIPPAPSGAIVQVDGKIHTGVIAGTETPINNLPFSDLTKRTYWQDNKRGSMTPATCKQDSSRAAICR